MKAYFFTFVGLYLIILVRYFIVSGLLYCLLWKFKSSPFAHRALNENLAIPPVMKSEIKWSVLTSLIFAISGTFMIESWKSGGTKIYLDPNQYGYFYLLASAPLYLFLHDTYFFWTHKLMHHPRLFKSVHQTHHNSRNPTPWASFSFSVYEAIIEALIIPLMAFFIPVHIGVLGFALISMTVFGVTNHAGYEIFPYSWMKGFWGKWMITATHHNLHHQNYAVNYGLYFRFWDKWLGTDKMPSPLNF